MIATCSWSLKFLEYTVEARGPQSQILSKRLTGAVCNTLPTMWLHVNLKSLQTLDMNKTHAQITLFLIKRWITITVVSINPRVRIACNFLLFYKDSSNLYWAFIMCQVWNILGGKMTKGFREGRARVLDTRSLLRWWCYILSCNLIILTNQRRFSEWKIPMEWNPSAQIYSWKQQTKKSWKWVHLPLFSFIWLALKIYHKCGGKNNKNLFSYSSKIKLLARLHSLQRS